MKKASREWVRKAESDYRLATKLTREADHYFDQLCFLCQQACEKYLKAVLEEAGVFIPKTHDLVHLLNLTSGHHPKLRRLRRGLKMVSRFAVAVRYPGANATKREVSACFRWPTHCRDDCRRLLKIRDHRPRKTP